MAKKKPSGGDLAFNRKARHEYELIETVECGLELTGAEVKSLREGGGSFADAYVYIDRGQAFLDGFHIRRYSNASKQSPHDPTRTRRLLLHSKQIGALVGKVKAKGYTLVPLRIYPQGRWLKMEVALGKGKRAYDKRQALKAKDARREMDRALKESRR